MELEQLRYFQIVARLESMTKAAEKLYISQPSLSKAISNLERNIGVPLFERRGRRILLNEFGKVFLSRVDRCFNELQSAQAEIDDLKTASSSKVSLATTSTNPLFVEIIQAFLSMNPETVFSFRQHSNHERLLDCLLDGSVDISISNLRIIHDSLVSRPLLEEEILLIKPAIADSNPFNISPESLAEDTFISVFTENGRRNITKEFCQQIGFEPKLSSCELNDSSADTLAAMVRAGFGNAFMSVHRWGTIDKRGIAALKLSDTPAKQIMWVSTNKDHFLSQAARSFLSYLEHECSKA